MPPQNNTRLWYSQPAAQWVEALPLGNGRLGGMVFGGIPDERITLNEETAWSGEPREWNNANARVNLPTVRRLLAEKRYAEADQLSKQMQGPWNQSYQPIGDLHLHFPDLSEPAVDYERDLDLTTGIASTRYTSGAIAFTRETFCSYPDQLLVMRLMCDNHGKLAFSASLTSPLRYTVEAIEDGSYHLLGQCPAHVEPNYVSAKDPIRYRDDAGIRFEIRLRVLSLNGSTTADAAGIHVEAGDQAVLLLAARTSFNTPDRDPYADGENFTALVNADLTAASGHSYDDLRERHICDHRALFCRVTLDLGSTPADERPTDARIAAANPAADPGLFALLFHYSRYLLIASSRSGTLPATLQGIWNEVMRPPWSSNWTINLNTQMNYWHAEPSNLSECVAPLIDFIVALSQHGRETARVNYGCGGWTAHHNVDLWLQTAPPGNFGDGTPNWAMWPLGGAWLAWHLWEHYLFNGDLQKLRDTAYPLIKGAAEFCLDWLVERNGMFITSPSSSPENMFQLPSGEVASLSESSTADMAIIRGVLDACLQAAVLLDSDPAFRARLRDTLDRLTRPKIGRYGQLQEWSEDWDRPGDAHRHISHLIGLFPGSELTPESTPDFCRAAVRSLDMRGDGGTTWSMTWKAACWARLGDGERAHTVLRQILLPSGAQNVEYHAHAGSYPNLFSAHPPFQIDANFGAAAAIIEMLLQSHTGEIQLLPALPCAWANGAVAGLRARGGFEVDLIWQDARLLKAQICSLQGGVCRIRSNARLIVYQHGQPHPFERLSHTLSFKTEPNGVYTLAAEPLTENEET
jgi:alpha-L-fucosidase 2